MPNDEVNLILFGDFGNGKPTQKTTAAAMTSYVERTRKQFNAGLTVGDNFYVKMTTVDDWQFQSLFEDMYDARVINFPVYLATGNHDYERAEGNKTKVDLAREWTAKWPTSRLKMPARWYRVDLPTGDAPLVTALMLDSSMPKLTKAEWEQQKRWIAGQLESSPARWKIACAHHPFYSNGSHGDNPIMQKEWGPIFRDGGLDFYVGGHDHDLQHLEMKEWPFSFIQAGGGGQPVTDMRIDRRGPFSRKLHGFVHAEFREDAARIRYIAQPDARVVHDFTRAAKGGAIEVIVSTGRDKGTVKPLKVLQEIRAEAREATEAVGKPAKTR